jgi:aspartyl-tRNA(Asn)/glutamyl-tRNA(Gln) amidotransferase subunit A
MAEAGLLFRSLSDIAEQIRRKDVSPVEVTRAVLGRLEHLNPRLNAFLTTLSEQALEAAKRAERDLVAGQPRGPLHGVPLALKDIFALRGVQVTGGSKVLGTWIPDYDATVVARLKAAGAVLVGTLNLYEFATGAVLNPHYGPTHNPWHLDHTTGGSSTGSGAAVAAGIVYGSLGTDTGGSVRIPASLCGLVGLKPTYGRVSRHGVIPLSWSLDHVGPLTRTVRDTALLMSVISGHDPHDPTTRRLPVPDYLASLTGEVAGLRVGVPREFFFEGLDADVQQAVEQAIRQLTSLGAQVSEVSWPSIRQAPALYAISLAEGAAAHEGWIRNRGEYYGADVRERTQQGLLVPATAYLKAQRVRAVVVRDLEGVFQGVDVLATPTSAIPAPKLDAGPGELGAPTGALRSALRRLTQPFNLTGSPAVTVPCGFSRGGLQLVGRPFDEARLLNLAHAYEHSTPWKDHHPALSSVLPQ